MSFRSFFYYENETCLKGIFFVFRTEWIEMLTNSNRINDDNFSIVCVLGSSIVISIFSCSTDRRIQCQWLRELSWNMVEVSLNLSLSLFFTSTFFISSFPLKFPPLLIRSNSFAKANKIYWEERKVSKNPNEMSVLYGIFAIDTENAALLPVIKYRWSSFANYPIILIKSWISY